MNIVPALLLMLVPVCTDGQVQEPLPSNTEQQLEQMAANNADTETEDDMNLQQMAAFIKDPINLNEADAALLQQLHLLTALQIQYFLAYRELVGKLIDIYELQAVPGWDMETIHKIRPYISVSIPVNVAASLKMRLRKGEHVVLLRATQVLEKARGYLIDPAAGTNYYLGSPQKILLRYTYRFKQLLQYGVLAEKDAGEQFLKGKQKAGFDFYSAHIFIRKLGMIRSLAIGDFTVNLGQGLTQWQGLAFTKSADVINIKRESEMIRPYHAAGEINFHRGLAIRIGKKKTSLTVFGSYKKIDANFIADTVQSNNDLVSSLQTSGYHRTKSEADDKGVQRQVAFGGNLSYQNRKLRLGMNVIRYSFKIPLVKTAVPYHLFALSGKAFGNYSVDYSYTFRNLHVFGEAAFSSAKKTAFINGLVMSASSGVDISLLYRNISAAYQSLYTSAFTENTYPNNEKGIYAGVSIRPNALFRIDAYADYYIFPWLKYRVNAPSTGSDYLLQLTYKPNKRLDIYSRFQTGSKGANANSGAFTVTPVASQHKTSWRTQIIYKANTNITLRSRAEIVWFNQKQQGSEQGFLILFDFIYKPWLQPYSANLRLQYFDTEGYNSRLYAYENDVLYSFSTPVFYNKGHRYYVNFNYEINKRLVLWIRWAQVIYMNKTLIGSGLDEIAGNKKSEVKLQVRYQF